MIPKVLIMTSWWPTKSSCWARFSATITRLLADKDVTTEFFITTSFSSSKFRSIAVSMAQASEWAIENGFTHILNIEADREIPDTNGMLKRLIDANKPVIIATQEGGTGIRRLRANTTDAMQGWGLMLVDTNVIRQVPFQSGFAGDYISPDKAWYKKLAMSGIDIWLVHDIVFAVMEPAADGPREGFEARSTG